jgi:ABC-2 type transport system permease protein
MSHLVNITRKELKELLTPGSVISVVAIMFMMMSIGLIVGEETEGLAKLSPVGVVDDDPDGFYAQYAIGLIEDVYISSGVAADDIGSFVVRIAGGSDDDIIRGMSEAGLGSAIVIAPDFSERIAAGEQGGIRSYYILSDPGMFSNVGSEINSVLLAHVNDRISYLLIEERLDDLSLSAAFLQNPVDISQTATSVNGTVHAGVSPYDISASLMGQMMTVPIIIMIIIVMIGSIVISSMGNEKENKTLETLLTLPVKRTTIVSGKLIASTIVGLVFGGLYMVGMSFYMSGMTAGAGGIDLADMGLSLTSVDWLMMGVMIFLTIMSALGMCMILGAFVKNYKAAQTMTLPISLLAMIPMFITMFIGWNSLPTAMQTVLFLIPFTHPMMGLSNLMFGEYLLVLSGIAYLAVFSLTMILLTVRIYKSDILITGLGPTRIGALKRKVSRR